jgi:hypothetical protein
MRPPREPRQESKAVLRAAPEEGSRLKIQEMCLTKPFFDGVVRGDGAPFASDSCGSMVPRRGRGAWSDVGSLAMSNATGDSRGC